MLKVDGNQIQNLTDTDFLWTRAIEILDLHGNEIRRIDTETFKSIRESLYSLDLSFNLLSSVNKSVRYLYELRRMKLSHNRIEVKTFSYTYSK